MSDTDRRTRTCTRARNASSSTTAKGSKQICIPMDRQQYAQVWSDAIAVRSILDSLIVESVEIFPSSIEQGYQLSGQLPESKKMPGIRLRQIRLQSGVYSLRPSFVMSYMSGDVEELEAALFLLSMNNPCWVVTQVCGHNDMFWYRHLERLGGNSVVGTTVPLAERLPVDLAADEHHCDWVGEKGYVAFTVGGGCILGVGLSASADQVHLTDAYGVFAREARDLNPNYAPETVNTDGWQATQNAFSALFSTIIPILCFLHGFLRIRDRGRKLRELHQKVWDVYRAESKQAFIQAMSDFKGWFDEGKWSQTVIEAVEKLCTRVELYALSYEHPHCHRTSNLVDRLMNRLTRYLYAGRGLHGHQASGELRLRGWALLNNFRPFAPRSGNERAFQSPAHRLNQKQYHPHWLHNLQICSSCKGFRRCT
jgi:hypothetical protein